MKKFIKKKNTNNWKYENENKNRKIIINEIFLKNLI